jgi:hypothetical protein
MGDATNKGRRPVAVFLVPRARGMRADGDEPNEAEGLQGRHVSCL